VFLQPLQAQPGSEQHSVSGAGLSVATSIYPLALIANDILAGHGNAVALIAAGDSPHHTTLSPSARLKAARADLLLWVGKDFEVTLTALFGEDPRTVTVSLLSDIRLYELDRGGLVEAHHDQAHALSLSEDHTEDHAEPHSLDLHLWLSTTNAEIIAQAISRAASNLDPSNAPHYSASLARFTAQQEHNREAFEAEFAALKRNKSDSQEAGLQDTPPYAVYHDAYRYFEREFGLSHRVALLVDPERAPSIRELSEVRASLASAQPQCLLTEPDSDLGLIATAMKGLAQETTLRRVEVDILGRKIDEGREGYTRLMRAVVADFVECLK
jgi:zinc transport system substrate-binding protein